MENYYAVASKLVPAVYLQQASDAKRSRENFIRDFLEHVNITLKLFIYK